MEEKISIIIVSWNVESLLEKCLLSIQKNKSNLNLEIIVVDNDSNDNTREMVREKFPEVKLIANQNNVGFAAANNQGIRESTGNYILLLNPDTEIIKNSLVKSLDFIKQNEKIGILGCKHLNTNLTIQHSVRRFPTITAIALIFFKIYKLLPNLPAIYRYMAKDFDYKVSKKVDQVAGSFMLIRKELLNEIGLLDENFFIWFEEVDLCKRAQDASWEVWYQSSAEIIHHGGSSFKQQMTLKKQKMFFKSALYYFQKHRLLP